MWATLFSSAAGSGGGGGGSSQTSGDRETILGTSGFTFGNYNAPASGIAPWQVMLLLAVLAFMLFKAVK